LINRKKIDNSLIINMDEIINEFDVLYNDLQFPFPTNIKTKVIKKYGRTRRLPNSLAVESTISFQELPNV